ncbi:MAG: hypothetical protein ABEI86_09285, partial [Halobacteriaceae archaeon]
MSRERDDRGRYTETITLADVLDVFKTVEGPVVTSSDVAEVLDCSQETARRKLQSLENRGQVTSRKTAGVIVWWIVDKQSAAREIHPADPFWEIDAGESGESNIS